MEFKDILSDLLSENGKSRMELSKEAQIPYTTICGWANGRLPDYNAIIKLSEYFNVSTDYILGRESDYATGFNDARIENRHKSHNYFKELDDLSSDEAFADMVKLFRAIPPKTRTLVLGYIIGMLQNSGVDTKGILE